jgi:hypothetical protein
MRIFAYVGCLLLLAGCASGGGGGAPGAGEAAQAAEAGGEDLYVLTAERLAADPSLTAMEAIRRHRRFWNTSNVFLKGNTRPEVGDVLQQWTADMILEIRYYRDADAMTKFGPEYRTAIEVTLKRQE